MKGMREHGTVLAVSVLLFASLVRSQVNSGSSCPKGTIKTGAQCIPCPRNTYSDEEGARKCKDCPSGYVTFSRSSTSLSDCKSCPLGRYVRNGTCDTCPIDTYTNKVEGATECIPCPPGTVSPKRTASLGGCKNCPIGLVPVREQSHISCEPCPPGQTTTAAKPLECQDCPPGTFQSETPRVLGGGKCQPCRPGSFADKKGTARCKPCPKGFYQTGMGATSCNKCPEGSTTNGERGKFCRSTCVPSEPGCISCPPGEGYNANKKRCEKCPNGFISPTASSTECFACPEGEGKSNDLRTKCVCKPGYRLKRNGTCKRCPNKYTSTDGATCICIATGKRGGPCECPEGQKFSFKENKCVKLKLASDCPDGTALYGDLCLKCPEDSVPNKSKTLCVCGAKGKGLRNGKCALCQPGEYATTVAFGPYPEYMECINCTAPQFSDKKGSVRCKNCPRGQEPSQDRATGCLPPCPPDAEREQYFFRGSNDKCECKSGFAATSGSDLDLVCEKCPKNTYVSAEGKCVCKAGYTRNEETGDCEPCPKGTFSDFSTEKKCEPCPPGEVATTKGQSSCTSCSKGLVSFQGIKCLPQCAKGYFRNEDENCVKCATGESC